MKKSKNKKFDSVSYMRKERDRISKEIADLSKEEIKEYFAKRRSRSRISD